MPSLRTFLPEVEWNPFSTASRAARADRSGRTEAALRLYVKAGQGDRIRECLLYSLPQGPTTSRLIEAAEEWVALRKGLDISVVQGMPDGWTDWFRQEIEATADVLWRSAGRMATASRHNVASSRLREKLKREGEKLVRVAAALHEARASLAELALSDGGQPLDLQKPESRLRGLAKAVRELDSQDDEPPREDELP